MIIFVLNTSLETIGLIDDYYSLTWAERYYVCGDFELELPIAYDKSPLITFGNFLYIPSSDILMVIEDMKPSSGEELTTLVVKGESAESLLKGRVLLGPVNLGRRKEPYSDFVEELLYGLMEDNVTAPTNVERRIPLFKTTFPTPSLPATYEDQVDIQTIYDLVVLLCKSAEYGFKIVKEDNKLAFSVYNGVDRSYSQSENQFIVFSENFDNVIASSFYSSIKNIVTIAFVSTNDPIFPAVFIWDPRRIGGGPEPEGLNRFEGILKVDIDRDLDSENPLSDSEVYNIIRTKGLALLDEQKTVGIFEGDFDIHGNFKYGEDFFMGDILQCYIEGRNLKARVIELVRSYSVEGEKSYVAMDFITIEDE